MERLCGVEETGRNAGAVEGADEFLADGRIFTDATEDEFVATENSSFDVSDHIGEGLIESRGGRFDGFAFEFEAVASFGEKEGAVH